MSEQEEAELNQVQAPEQLCIELNRVWSDPVIKQALNYVRADIRKESENSRPEERELREHCYYLLNAVVKIEKRLTLFAERGKRALDRKSRTS